MADRDVFSDPRVGDVVGCCEVRAVTAAGRVRVWDTIDEKEELYGAQAWRDLATAPRLKVVRVEDRP